MRRAAISHVAGGHTLYVITWIYSNGKERPLFSDCLELFEEIKVVTIHGSKVWEVYPQRPWQAALSHYLVPEILTFIREIEPDLIETSDYQSPLFGYLTHRRAGLIPDIDFIPVVTSNHGGEHSLYRPAGKFMNLNSHHEIAAQRSMLRWSDGILVPSKLTGE